MEFITLQINNFLAIGNGPMMSLDNKGLVLIQGENQDDTSANSNGVGKSSIADALCWALYGETARGESGDAVVNAVAKKDCYVRVVILDGATSYQITRYRKHKEYKNQTIVQAWTMSDPGTLIDMTKGTEKETQALINSIMGCSLEVFMAAIYAGQDVTPDIPKMTDKQLKTLIEEAAGSDRLERASEIAQGRVRAAKAERVVAESAFESAKKAVEEGEFYVKATAKELQDFEDGREAKARTFAESANTERVVLLKLAESIKSIDEAKLVADRERVKQALMENAKLVKGIDPLQFYVNAAQRKLDQETIALERLVKTLKDTKFAFDNAESAVLKPCPSCGKVGGTEHDVETFRAHTKERMGELATQIRSQQAVVAAETEAFEKKRTELEAYKASIPDVSDLVRQQSELDAKLREIDKKKEALAKGKVIYDTYRQRENEARTCPNPHASMLDTLQKKLEGKKEELETAKGKSEAAVTRCELVEAAAKVFGPAGVRAHILDTVTPFLNERTSDYLSFLSDGNISAVWTTLAETTKGELREKFNIEVSNDKGGKTFKSLSGGEKRKVRIATMLALQDLVASRASKPINLWVGDEIDDALDRSGLERLMGILERKAREKGTVLIISHNDLKDWCDQTTSVVKSGGTSRIEGALCE